MKPVEILTGIWHDIRAVTLEGERRSWEYLVEMMAHASGWDTETSDSVWIWDLIPNHQRFVDYAMAWSNEVAAAKEAGIAFSEPLGDLLQMIKPDSLVPMTEVRAINAKDLPEQSSDTFSGLDPHCGTGRFMLDAVVHNDHVIMHGVDTDVWMLRAALVNIRYLFSHTSLHVKGPKNGELLVLGGRTVFMHGDPRIVDLGHANNWLCGGWSWTPQPWEVNLQIAPRFGFKGSWRSFQRLLGGPELAMARLTGLDESKRNFAFDFSMGETLDRPRSAPDLRRASEHLDQTRLFDPAGSLQSRKGS